MDEIESFKHDLRNHLHSISLCNELIMEDSNAKEKILRYCDKIKQIISIIIKSFDK